MRLSVFGHLSWNDARDDSPRLASFDANATPLRTLLGRLRTNMSGIAFVETALAAPILALIIMGTTDAARYGAARMKIQQAVNRGLEMSWMGGADVTVAAITEQAAAQADVPTTAVTVTQALECGGTPTAWTTDANPCASGETARYTQVNISTTFTPSFAGGALAKMLGNSNGVVPISATGVLRIQ